MAFTVPAMPLDADVYTAGTYPAGPPRLTTVANLAQGRRITTEYTMMVADGDGLLFIGPSTLLVPAGTDIRGIETGPETPDVVDCPAGSGRVYIVLRVDDYGKGFPNEHRFAVMTPFPALFPWPVPIP